MRDKLNLKRGEAPPRIRNPRMELLLSIVRKCLERGERLAVFSHSVSTLREIEDEFRVGLKDREEFQVPASPKLVTVYVGQSFICMYV